MKWWIVLALLFLAACATNEVVCTEPYMQLGRGCCLDANNDSICDNDQKDAEGVLSCDLCPPEFVTETEEVTVYRYVCQNQSVVDSPDDCEAGPSSNAHLFDPVVQQNESLILDFSARPACRGKDKVAEVHLELNRTARNVAFKVKENPSGPYNDLFTTEDNVIVDDDYFYIHFCDSLNCGPGADAVVEPSDAFLLRALITYSDNSYFSKDILIDPTPEGEFGKQRC